LKPTVREQLLQPLVTPLQSKLERFFRGQSTKFMTLFRRTKSGWITEAGSPPPPLSPADWEALFNLIALDSYGVIGHDLDQYAREAMIKGGLLQAGTMNIAASFTLANPAAKEYLENYGYKLISNIDNTTRSQIGKIINLGMEQGDGYSKVARNITDMFSGFSTPSTQPNIKNRAELIAVTEMGNAYESAALTQGKALSLAGLPIEKSWYATGTNLCDDCLANAEVGWIPVDEPFPSGSDRPLEHPGCLCDLLTRLAEEA
jgi:hypothetical protein